MVLLLNTYFQNHMYATQFPYHGGSYSDRNLHQCPLQAWTLATEWCHTWTTDLPPSPLPHPSPLPNLPSPYWSLCGSRHHSVWPLKASLVYFPPVLSISPQWRRGGGRRYFTHMVQVWCHPPFQSPEGIIAQYGETGFGIYGVFIGITNEPSITLPSSLHILNTLGYFNCVFMLFLHKTVPLSQHKINWLSILFHSWIVIVEICQSAEP